MSREIKVRGWDKLEKKMKPGKTLSELLAIAAEAAVGYELHEIAKAKDFDKRFIYMQSIGSKDKNGVEIYESDIVVYWQLGGNGKRYKCQSYTRTIKWLESKNISGWNIGRMTGNYEVVGNKFENKELLKTL